MVYEGISTLCFSCGRVGRKSEACPYTIQALTTESQMEDEDGQSPTKESGSPYLMPREGRKGSS